MLSSRNLRIWIVNNEEKLYCTGIGVYRAMFHHGKPRIILYELLTANPTTASNLISFVPRSHILLMNCEVGRPDNFVNNDPIISFFECSVRRSWLPRAVVPESTDAHNVTLYTEFEAERYAWENKAIGDDFLFLKGITRQQIVNVALAFDLTSQEIVELLLKQRNK